MKAKDTFFSKNETLNFGGELVKMQYPVVMGIVNITPDSFYAESRVNSEEELIRRVQTQLDNGAFCIDLGAYSTRPNAQDIDIEEEIKRLDWALKIIKKEFSKTIISVDTFRSEVVRWAYNTYGISVVNDVSGGLADAEMFRTIATVKVPYILMHTRGTPQNMQSMAQYNNVTKEVMFELSVQLNKARDCGVSDIIIDPGFGFAKNLEQNYELLSNLEVFQFFELPIMVGLSRKSMVYKLLNTTPDNALNGTTALNTIALLKKADILRVHDVKQAVEVIKIVKNLTKFK